MKFEGTATWTNRVNDLNYHRLFSAKRYWNQKVGFELVVRDNKDHRLHGRGAQDNPNFDIHAWDGLTQSAWEHVTFVVNGKDQTITTFNGGVQLETRAMSAPGDLSEGMMIGNDAELNDHGMDGKMDEILSLIHISEPTRRTPIS